MKEVNYIMQTAASNSLIIIDELGRGNVLCIILSLIKLGTFILNYIFRNLSEMAFVAPALALLVSGFSLLNTPSSIYQH